MSERAFCIALLTLALGFSAYFFGSVVPGALPVEDFVRTALLDGYVNATASGYTTDALFSGAVLLVWIAYERTARGVRHGWIAAVLCFVPGVAVGLATYLLIR